jgi:hypothetical protein
VGLLQQKNSILLVFMKISESKIQNQEPKKTALLKKGYLVSTIIRRLSRMVERNLLVEEEARAPSFGVSTVMRH